MSTSPNSGLCDRRTDGARVSVTDSPQGDQVVRNAATSASNHTAASAGFMGPSSLAARYLKELWGWSAEAMLGTPARQAEPSPERCWPEAGLWQLAWPTA